ncbi:hypothetical protein Hanom_Chr02g00119891 [Helianthus anomalus]
MSSSTKPGGSKKRQSRPKDPMGHDHAVINWKEEEFHNLWQRFKFPSDWGAQFSTSGNTALNAPPGYMTLYVAFFREGNFHLLMTKFFGEILSRYGLHISQINALDLPHVTYFEFICQAQWLVPTVDMFNIFYYVSYTGGFYSLNYRTANVLPCNKDPPKSLHDWKHRFFYIRRSVIPIAMHYRTESEEVPKIMIGAHTPTGTGTRL